MTKEELKALGLTDEQIGKVEEAYKGFRITPACAGTTPL